MRFFKENKKTEIASPITGEYLAIEEVPDPVFSKKMMGEGFAVIPTTDLVVAPFDGKVVMVADKTYHAIGLLSDSNLEILIHIGLDTVGLGGEGFEKLVDKGMKVKKGQPLIKFQRAHIEEMGINTTTMLVVVNDNDKKLNNIDISNEVQAGLTTIMMYE